MTRAGSQPRDFAVLLPPGWARIPLDGREGARANALAADRTADLAEPQRSAARDKLARMIRGALRDAKTAGGIDVLLSLAERDGIPLAASCLISYLDRGEEVPLDALAAELCESESESGGIVTKAEVGGQPAIRRRSAADGITRLDYYLPVPGRPTGFLVLAFATPVEPLADALVTLFDAIAVSLRWQA